MGLKLTVISPCYNESASIRECAERTEKSVKLFDENIEYEHIFIDNASSDTTLADLITLREDFPQIRILQNDENIGVFQSIQMAIRYSRGEWVIPFLPVDNQDPPEIITEFLRLQKESNCDSVFGVRETRIESKLLLMVRKIFYLLLRIGLGGKYEPGTSEFCLIRKDVADKLTRLEDKNPFLRVYLSKMQGEVRYFKYRMEPRKFGKSSASIFTLADDALNAFSVVMPSIFSRLIVISSPVFLIFLLSFFTSLIAYAVKREYIYFIMLLLSLSFTILTFILVLISILGHYIYMLHSQIRASKFTETNEI